MTRTEAAEFLRVSVDTIDRRTIPMKQGPVLGKFRFVKMPTFGLRSVRILSEDVFAVLPEQKEAA